MTIAGCGSGDSDLITASSSKYEVDTGDRESTSSSRPTASPQELDSQTDQTISGDNPPPDPTLSTVDLGDPKAADALRPGGQKPAAAPKSKSPPPTSTSSNETSQTPGARKTGGDEAPADGKTNDTNPDETADEEPEDPAVAKLVAKLNELAQKRPKGTNREEMVAEFRDIQAQRVGLAQRLFTMKSSSRARLLGARSIIEAYSILGQLGDPNVNRELKKFSQTLSGDADPSLAQMGRRMLFGISVDEFTNNRKADPKKLLEDIRTLIADGKQDEASFMLAVQASSALSENGARDEAKLAFASIAETFADHPKAELAAQARSIAEQSRLVDLDIPAKMQATLAGEANAAEQLLEALQTIFDAKAAGEPTLQIVTQAAAIFETTQPAETVERLWTMIEEAYANHPNEELAKEAQKSIDLGRTRIGLVGKPFEVSGPQMDGTPLDWKQYEGKVVLVDFWATWCGPCLNEIPNIRQALEQFRDRGFEVVGISIDEEQQDLDRFFAVQKLPWTTVIDNIRKPGEEKRVSMLEKCGVISIPFTVLVGRDGHAVAINLRGPNLEKKLEELLGSEEAPEKTPEKASEGKAAPKPDPAKGKAVKKDGANDDS